MGNRVAKVENSRVGGTTTPRQATSTKPSVDRMKATDALNVLPGTSDLRSKLMTKPAERLTRRAKELHWRVGGSGGVGGGKIDKSRSGDFGSNPALVVQDMSTIVILLSQGEVGEGFGKTDTVAKFDACRGKP
jgi:hypothetical protein